MYNRLQSEGDTDEHVGVALKRVGFTVVLRFVVVELVMLITVCTTFVGVKNPLAIGIPERVV